MSERRACKVLGYARAVQRHTPRVRDDEDRLTGRIVQPAAVYGRHGTPRINAMLRHEGWHVNHKRVERIWRRVGLKVPRRQPRRGRLWLNDGSCIRLRQGSHSHILWYVNRGRVKRGFSAPIRCRAVRIRLRRCADLSG